jgi:ADP-ribose pyrophosphatase YjhB (NUDIX family)
MISAAVAEVTRRALGPELAPFVKALEDNVDRWEDQADTVAGAAKGLAERQRDLGSFQDELAERLAELGQRQAEFIAALARVEAALNDQASLLEAARAHGESLAGHIHALAVERPQSGAKDAQIPQRPAAVGEEASAARIIDYYDDPFVPAPNSLVPSVNVVVANDAGEILMIRRSDNDNWAVPGGTIGLGESVAQAAVRETLEESGITCELTGLVGIYSNPRHVILYTSNGEARREFSIVLTARPVSGTPTPSDESAQVRWVPASDLPEYTLDRSMRSRVSDYLRGDSQPVVT